MLFMRTQRNSILALLVINYQKHTLIFCILIYDSLKDVMLVELHTAYLTYSNSTKALHLWLYLVYY